MFITIIALQIISLGSTKLSYAAGGEGLLSFKINTPVRILSKSAGTDPQLWGVEINGRRGYANKDFIREQKIYVSEKMLEFEVPVLGTAKPQEQQPAPTTTGETQQPASSSPSDAQPGPAPNQQADHTSLENAIAAEASPSKGAEQTLDKPKEPQTVLNASESADDIVTTTTSPLNVKPDIILTHQDNETTKEAPVPSTPIKPNLQLVDGTALPLEAEPATTDHVSNEPKVQPPAMKNEINIESDENDDDDDFDYEEDDDEELDGKIYEELNDKINIKQDSVKEGDKVENVANVEDIKKADSDAVPKISKQEGLITEPLKNTQVVEEEKPESDAQAAPVQKEEKVQETHGDILLETRTVEASPEILKEKATTEATLPMGLTKSQTADPPAVLPVQQKDKAQDEIQPLVEPTEDQTVEPVKQAAEKTEDSVLAANHTNAAEPTGQQPAPALSEQATSLPPLLSKQNYMNPNDYYRSLQEQQVEKRPLLKQEQEPPKSTHKDLSQPKLEEEQQHTTPSYDMPFDSLHDAEVTPAPKTTQQSAEGTTQSPELVLETAEAAPQISEVAPQISEEAPQISEVAPQISEAAPQRIDVPPQKAEVPELTSHAAAEITKPPEVATLDASRQSEQIPEPVSISPNLSSNEEETHDVTFNHSEAIPQSLDVASIPDEGTLDTATTNLPSHEAQDSAPAQTELPTAAPAEPIVLPSTSTPSYDSEVLKDDAGPGLFATILGTVNSFISTQAKEPQTAPLTGNDDLHRILYPDGAAPSVAAAEGHCMRPGALGGRGCHASISLDNFPEVLAAKVLDHSQLLLCVVIAAASSLFFIFAYYCFCNSSQEGSLLSKLNMLERSLLAAHKENQILKHDIMATRTKLSSIEDNSFGSNDMVMALKKQLETEIYEKSKLQEQVNSLEKDLDNAAEAGLELNKMLSEVLNSQNGDEAFMSTVDELQRQLNDQEKIIIDINSSLAEKSRENSELQYSFTESSARLSSEMKQLQQDNYELELEKAKLLTRIEEIESSTEKELAKVLEARNYEMQRLQNQILELNSKWEKEHSELQTSLAKIEALEDCLKTVKKDSKLNVQELITSAKTRGELNAAQKKFASLQSQLEQEVAAKARLESQLKQASADVEKLKQDYNQSESEKLEAQTRLEVLSGYFREKETQLQKELSLQEAKWLQHQGENASTVESQTLMKTEIQTLKSQNDELRAEIEAQIASHKAQMGTLENRAHESWLAARQSERRCEEALAEAAGLRRKLTAMASGSSVGLDPMCNGVVGPADAPLGVDMKNAPSPLPGLPSSPLLNMPNPLPFLAGPFPPFMGLPPPFLPPTAGGARPPPLGRMRSPPPTSRDDSRYSPHPGDYSDYDDYDDDDDDHVYRHDRDMGRDRRHSGSWGRRDSYRHSPPRTYRSLSPSDSRYNYNDTETDFSPPPSPPPPPRNGGSRPMSEV
ncbi:transport and Golgi organization protein 1 isoform X2 [Scaptodrosophila lebanonensis]|uniref:Transport and Golgi organization protein 1 isoform X2 n=1 Tax=Drosophila lebanonensis TaxID=7225 RepID=A0A6J2TLD1_DROLE|nr:transport and Golgi organization protein 1 isoform X2 [Scaptodrosophila lebanonensis]